MTTLRHKVRRVLNDPTAPGSLSSRARAKRWSELMSRFPDLAALRVLDLGGLPSFWRAAQTRPAELTTVNLVEAEAPEPWIRHLVDDACAPGQIEGERFDLVVSNSLLEHVGGYAPRRDLAEVIRGAAPRHWVQTPYRYFPIEPHWMFPGLQFLPTAARAAAIRHWPLGYSRLSGDDATDAVLATELVSITELRLLFPDSDIWHERAAGLTKSIVAVRT
ncbi:class I SAM-dependent methyltransferase [Actinokineospora sp. NBRC 105648]|uniref:class I SAM-dependent methyltransferase n=1 Tax=Actinokineospora sp. NBRC 105648 TaxID=3032206 RepID=UPI00255668FF|nr:class I SAM-dependent methyltransferase [Actinokineospora sp. NBRC 105648]